MKKTKQYFHFQPFSRKQRQVLNWWTEESPVKDCDGIIADGAIRSGKTVSMSLSFVLWAMSSFQGQNFAMCGKTIGSFRRNVLFWLKLMLKSREVIVFRITEQIILLSSRKVTSRTISTYSVEKTNDHRILSRELPWPVCFLTRLH